MGGWHRGWVDGSVGGWMDGIITSSENIVLAGWVGGWMAFSSSVANTGQSRTAKIVVD